MMTMGIAIMIGLLSGIIIIKKERLKQHKLRKTFTHCLAS